MIEITKYDTNTSVSIKEMQVGEYFEYDDTLFLVIDNFGVGEREYINVRNGERVTIHGASFVRKVDVSIRYCYSLIDKKT